MDAASDSYNAVKETRCSSPNLIRSDIMPKIKDHFIHKHGYGFLFKDPEYMKRLIRDFVDKNFYNQLDFKNCEPLIEKTYITEEYREFSEDLVYKIKLRGKDAYIFILVEFQSEPDKFISVRILNYVTLFYLDYIKEYKAANERVPDLLPPVLPILMYNGNKPWNYPFNVKDVIEDDEFLRRFYPDFSYFKIIARDFSIEDLKQIGSIVSSIFLVERFGKEELDEISENLKDVLETEDLHVLKLFVVWMKHLLFNKRLDERAYIEAMNIRNKKETKSMLVETIHKWRQELENIGMKKGEKVGIKKGERRNAVKTAEKLLALNTLTIEQIANSTGLHPEEVIQLQTP